LTIPLLLLLARAGRQRDASTRPLRKSRKERGTRQYSFTRFLPVSVSGFYNDSDWSPLQQPQLFHKLSGRPTGAAGRGRL